MIYKIQQGKLDWGEKSEEESQNQAKKRNQKWVLLHTSVLWVSCWFCPTSTYSLQLVTGAICLWRNLHFPTLTLCCSGVLTTPWSNKWAKAEGEMKIEAGDVNWLHEPSSRSDLYCCKRESLFPLGLELEDSANNHLETSDRGKGA